MSKADRFIKPSKKFKGESYKFELKLANGRSGRFDNGYDMWKFAIQNGVKINVKSEDN